MHSSVRLTHFINRAPFVTFRREIREGIIRCILATDMARHNDILTQFREIIPIFDYKNNSHKNLVSNAICVRGDVNRLTTDTSCEGKRYEYLLTTPKMFIHGRPRRHDSRLSRDMSKLFSWAAERLTVKRVRMIDGPSRCISHFNSIRQPFRISPFYYLSLRLRISLNLRLFGLLRVGAEKL